MAYVLNCRKFNRCSQGSCRAGVLKVIPEDRWSPALFKRTRDQAIGELRGKYDFSLNCGCGHPAWRMEYTDFLSGLRKPEDKHRRCDGCALGKGVFEDHIHLIFRAAYPRVGRAVLERVTRLKEEFPQACMHGLQSVLKKETGLFKMGGSQITPYWREFCYWELGYGFVPYKEVRDLIPEAKEWLGEHLELGGPLGEHAYMVLLAEEVKKFMTSEWRVPKKKMTVVEWVKTCKWLEGKSGTGASLKVEVEGRKAQRARGKGVDGYYKHDELIELELTTPSQEEMHVMQKSEGSKIRPVVKTGNEVNRKMNYLSTYLEDGLHGSPLSTLFAGEVGNEQIDYDLIRAVRSDVLWKVPLDQGGFDQHQSWESIKVVLATIGSHIATAMPDSDFSKVFDALWTSLFCKGALVHVGEVRFRWCNGLPSGWRWTAILDTILNVCSFRVMCRIADRLTGVNNIVRHFYAQGDDVVFAASDLTFIQVLIDCYGKVGYEVHPLKTYISRTRAEFLRRSYEPAGVTGYLARSFVNIRFRNPVQASPLTPGERLYSNLSQWHLLSLRVASPEKCASLYLEYARAQGLDTKRAALAPGCSPIEKRILELEKQLEETRMTAGANSRIVRNFEDAGPFGWEKEGSMKVGTEKNRDPKHLEEKEKERGARPLVVQRVAPKPEVLDEHGGREVQPVLAAAQR